MSKDPAFLYKHSPYRAFFKTTKHRVLKKARKYFHIDRIPADLKDRPSTWYGPLTATVSIEDLERQGKAQDSRKNCDDWYCTSPEAPSKTPPRPNWSRWGAILPQHHGLRCFTVLGLSDKASLQDIKQAFRQMAHLHHPDLGGDAEKFKKARAAYEEALRLVGGTR